MGPEASLAEAEKAFTNARTKKSWAFWSEPQEDQLESAMNMFIKVAKQYKEREQYVEAGRAYERAAEVATTKPLDYPTEAVRHLETAAKLYGPNRPLDVVRVLGRAIHLQSTKSELGDPVNLYTLLGDMTKSTPGFRRVAYNSFVKATNLSALNRRPHAANKAAFTAAEVALQIADLPADPTPPGPDIPPDTLKDGHDHVIELMMGAIDRALNDSYAMSVPKYGLMAGIAKLATGDSAGLEVLVEKLCRLDDSSIAQRNYNWLRDLNTALEHRDAVAFETIRLQAGPEVGPAQKEVLRQLQESIPKEAAAAAADNDDDFC